MLRQMRYFIAVVEANSFSEAAELCHISQSAVSQQIRALEDELGVALLERRGRRFELTPAGRWFYESARRQVAQVNSAVSEAQRIGRGEYQRLRVGVLTGFGGRIVQNAVGDFAASHPHVQLTLTSGTHEALFQQVTSGSLDLVINDQRRTLAEHFVNDALGERQLFALVRQDSPEARLSVATMEALASERCIVVAPAGQRENEATYWRDVMAFPGDLLFVDGMEEACLNAAAGVGWLPCDHDVAVAGTVLLPLTGGGTPLTQRMFAFRLKERDSALHREFAETVRGHFV